MGTWHDIKMDEEYVHLIIKPLYQGLHRSHLNLYQHRQHLFLYRFIRKLIGSEGPCETVSQHWTYNGAREACTVAVHAQMEKRKAEWKRRYDAAAAE